MITIYLAHPVRGDVDTNLRRAKEWYRYFIRHYDVAIIADWIITCEVLNDTVLADRKRGTIANHHLLPSANEVWICGHEISSGMRDELIHALNLGKRVRWFRFADVPRERVDLVSLPNWTPEFT